MSSKKEIFRDKYFSYNKKGDLEIRYIVLLALAILVLIVIALIFSGTSQKFTQAIKDFFAQVLSIKPKL